MKTKLSTRIISLTLIFTLLLTICGIVPVWAIDSTNDTNENRGHLSMAYLGTGTSPATTAQSIPDTSSWEADQTFWVGIYISDMKTMDTANASTLTSGVSSMFEIGDNVFTTGGVFSFSSGIIYDADYLEPIAEDVGGSDEENMQEQLSSALLSMPLWEDYSNRYTADGVTAFKVDPLDHESAETTGITGSNKKTLAWSVTSSNALNRVWRTANSLTNDPLYLLVVQFKLKAKPTAGTTVVSVARNAGQLVFQTGTDGERWGAQWNKTRSITPEENLKNFLDYTGDLDLFPASASDYLDKITVTGTLTKLLNSYIEGNKFEPAGITVTPQKTESGNLTAITPANNDFKDLKFYVDDAGKTASTLATTRELTTTTSLATTDSGKHVYVSYTLNGKTAIADLGEITVSAKSVSSIAIKTADNATTFGTGSYYTTTNVTGLLTKTTDPETLTITVTYDNGTTEDIAYASFGSNYALAKVGGDSKLAEVASTDTFAEGVNTFYVVQKGNLGKTLDAIGTNLKPSITTTSVTKDTLVIKSIANAKLSYTTAEDTSGDKRNVIDFSTADITTYSKSVGDNDTTNTTQKVSALGANNLIFYTGSTNVPADNTYGDGTGKTIITSGTTLYTSDLEDKYVFVVPADDTTATPVLVGQLKDREISTDATDIGDGYAVTGITTDQNTKYGDTLGSGAKITVKYDNGDTKEISYADFETAGITMKIVDKDGNVLAQAASDTTVLTPAMSGGKVEFYYNDTKIGTSTVLTVNKKDVKITISSPNTAITKTYDGGTDLPANTSVGTLGFDGFETADSTVTANLDPDGLTFAYNSKSAGTDKKIAVTGTPGVKAKDGVTVTDENLADINSKYSFSLGDGFSAEGYVQNNGADLTAAITAKTLNITSITNVPSVEVGATEGLTGTSTLALKNNSETDTNSDLIKGDVVTLTYKYEYAQADVGQTGNPTVTITATGTEGETTLGLSGTDAGNYTLGALPTETKGTVENKTLNTITINTPPTAEYTYPDIKLDLSDIKFNLNYEGATEATVIDLAQFIEDGGIITLTDAAGQTQTITADNAEGVISLAYGKTELSISYAGKTATTTVTANRKPIKLSEITFTASKVYGEDDITKTATAPAGAIEAADADNVKFTFDATFADTEAGEGKKVTISNIALTGDAADNYVIVDDNGNAITSATDTTIDTGVISQGEQTAPAAPTVTVDNQTNNIVVSGPLGDNIEYSIDGGATWQSETTFTGLTKGTSYNVVARTKETADGNYGPSDASGAATIKTYANRVRAFKKNADITTATPAKDFWTDITEAESVADINTEIFDKKPSSFKAYYTNTACTSDSKVEYPFTITSDTVLFYTTSSGGGGGSSSSTATYTVKFNAGSNGKITDGKTSVSVTSGAKIDEASIPTVTADDGYTFIGWSQDGETTVNPATVSITKATTFKALYEETADATPTPTTEPAAEPTDEPDNTPVINREYTKPYASGYEDDSFRPNDNITRAELASMIARLSYGDDIPDGMYVSSFPDVDADSWFGKYVGYLEGLDVLSGYEDGTFRPYNTVTRSEIATVIARAQRYDLIPYSGIFTDVTDDDWAKDYIQTLAEMNIISGYTEDTFGPYSSLTRAEAVTVINNVLAPSTAIVTFTPNDISGHWAEGNIILAVNDRMLDGALVGNLGPAEIPEEIPEPEMTEPEAEEGTEIPEGEIDAAETDEPAEQETPEE